jgi:monoamine oxidase
MVGKKARGDPQRRAANQSSIRTRTRSNAGRKPAGKPPHVVILGAGIAGLCAAYELEQRGWTTTILEAERHHIGGRVRTVRFSDGQYGEFGAMRIPETHNWTRYYARQFGLQLRPFIMENDAAYYHVRGRRERRADWRKISEAFGLQGQEAGKKPGEFWDQAVVGQLDRLTEAEKAELDGSDSFGTAALNRLDRMSMRGAMDMAGLSEDAIEYLFSLFAVGTLQHSALTEHLREELQKVWSLSFCEIVGGTGRLPEALVGALRSPPKMGCEVVALRQTERGVEAVYKANGGAELKRQGGDFMLCTIPLPVLARLDVDPQFSAAKRRAIADVFYESATKVLVPTTTRVWETVDRICGGSSATDMLIGPLFYPSDNATRESDTATTTTPTSAAVSKGPGVLVASYTWGLDARRLGNMPTSQREELAIRLAARVHPELDHPGVIRRNEVRSWFWDQHRWSGGAFAFYMPGQFATLHRHVVAPEGRIHFAGEHCSRSHSWMQGAFESARAAVDALVARAPS